MRSTTPTTIRRASAKALTVALGLCGLLLASAQETRADAVQLFTRAQLSPTAATTQYPEPAFSILASPYVLGAMGNTLTFSNNGQFERRDDGPDFQTDFATGTRLLLSQATGVNNVTTISFATGVTQLGLDLQSFPLVGDFTVEVFNGATSLGTFNLTDVSGDGLPAFFGVSATDGDVITSLRITGLTSGTGFTTAFALGPVSYVNGPAAPAEVPEPATLLLLSTGLAGATAAARRRRPRGGNANESGS